MSPYFLGFSDRNIQLCLNHLNSATGLGVLLGLIQLSKLRGFAERQVSFTRYQLIGILGWRNESKSYERVETSLNRWTGVTLYYQNAWWNKARRCWINEKFHVLDNVWLCHRGVFALSSARSSVPERGKSG